MRDDRLSGRIIPSAGEREPGGIAPAQERVEGEKAVKLEAESIGPAVFQQGLQGDPVPVAEARERGRAGDEDETPEGQAQIVHDGNVGGDYLCVIGQSAPRWAAMSRG